VVSTYTANPAEKQTGGGARPPPGAGTAPKTGASQRPRPAAGLATVQKPGGYGLKRGARCALGPCVNAWEGVPGYQHVETLFYLTFGHPVGPCSRRKPPPAPPLVMGTVNRYVTSEGLSGGCHVGHVRRARMCCHRPACRRRTRGASCRHAARPGKRLRRSRLGSSLRSGLRQNQEKPGSPAGPSTTSYLVLIPPPMGRQYSPLGGKDTEPKPTDTIIKKNHYIGTPSISP